MQVDAKSEMARDSGGALLLMLLLLALLLRFMAVRGTEIDEPLRADAGQYYTYANNLDNYGVYSREIVPAASDVQPTPDHFRNPGYPVLLMPFAAEEPTRSTVRRITLAQAGLSALSVLVAYALARELLPRAAALGAALLVGLSPHLINMNVYVLSETASAFFILLFLLWFVRCCRNQDARWWWWALAGALLAAATLVRPTVQWLVVPMLVVAWLVRRPAMGWRAGSLLLGFLLVMSPWWGRNLVQFGETSDSSLMRSTIHHGMYPDFMFEGRSDTFGFPYRHDPRSEEIVKDMGSLATEIVRRFRDEPVQHMRWFLVGKPLTFWAWSNDAQATGDIFIYRATKTPFDTNPLLIAAHRTMRLLHWPLVALGMIGALLCWSRRASRQLAPGQAWGLRACALTLLYFLAVHIVGAPFSRYSIPILPVLYIQAIGTLVLLRALLRPEAAT